MFTLTDVRAAMKQGDTPRAVEIIKTILKENPSADAWYLAARMNTDTANALRCLRQALMLDPKHGPSLTLMRSLGGESKGFFGHLSDEIIITVYEQSDKSPVLRHFPRRAQLAAVGLLTAIILAGFLVSGAMLVSSMQAAMPAPVPTVEPIKLVSVDETLNGFREAGLELLDVQVTAGARGARVIRFELEGEQGKRYPIMVQVYDSVSALISEWNANKTLDPMLRVVGAPNAVLFYPVRLDVSLANQLAQEFRSIAGL